MIVSWQVYMFGVSIVPIVGFYDCSDGVVFLTDRIIRTVVVVF
jgi:hypothetical protein